MGSGNNDIKKIAVLGSTGSIGVQTLDVVRETVCAKIIGLTANSNIELLEKQIIEFKPSFAAVMDSSKAAELTRRLKLTNCKTKILAGMEGILEIVSLTEVNIVVNALVGSIGLLPTLTSVRAGKDIALANKESLVSGGEIVMPLAREKGVNIYPVDSEHSAILQCLRGNEENTVSQIFLTASGGPFRTKTKEELKTVTLADALAHPNWSMGKKITIDSATLMNKGLEVIEACHLFNLPTSKITVVVHSQSIIHSMVEFEDGAVMAQLGLPDMRVPIQYALTYPKRLKNNFQRLNFFEKNTFNFEKPRIDIFPCLNLAIEAFNKGKTYPAVLNAANETAVSAFLDGKIRFVDIPLLIENALSAYTLTNEFSIEAVFSAEKWAREFVNGSL